MTPVTITRGGTGRATECVIPALVVEERAAPKTRQGLRADVPAELEEYLC
jgi:hypothetical protein